MAMLANKTIWLYLFLFWSINLNGQDCQSATELFLGTCQFGTIENTTFNGVQPQCSLDPAKNIGSVWHFFTSPSSGLLTIKSNADFNDVLTVYSGSSCTQLFELNCKNEDEYGFRGEKLNLALSGGQTYYVRISGFDGEHSSALGEYCIELSEGAAITPTPYYDNCNTPKIVIVDGNTVADESNLNTGINILPEKNIKSRASVWYKFLAPADGAFTVTTNASFADAIVIYNNDCSNLTEIITEVDGYGLRLPNLMANTEYLIQVSGYFADLTGSLSLEIKTAVPPPSNDSCDDGEFLTVNDPCTSGTLKSATASADISECAVYQGPGVWYLFLAPGSQKVHLNVEADYPYNAALYTGPCLDREEIWCVKNTSSCIKSPEIINLQPNFLYYLYISASSEFYNPESDFCISLIDGNLPSPTSPLSASPVLTCYADGSSEINIDISGGSPPYKQFGIQNGSLLQNAENFEFTVIDEQGCAINDVSVSNCFNIESQCPKVADLDTLTVSGSAVTLSWTAQSLSSAFTIRYKPVNSDVWSKVNATNTVAFITGLTSCTLYEAQILSDCSIIGSGYSESLYFSTKNCPVCTAPVSLFEFNVTSATAILTWDVSVSADTYILNYRKLGQSNWVSYETNYPLTVLFGLSLCSTYEYFVEVSCGGLITNSQNTKVFTTANCKDESEVITDIDVIDIYPNPASSELNIQFENAIPETYLLSIYSMEGKIVHSEFIPKATADFTLQIDDTHIMRGIYRLELASSSHSISEKIIIQ